MGPTFVAIELFAPYAVGDVRSALYDSGFLLVLIVLMVGVATVISLHQRAWTATRLTVDGAGIRLDFGRSRSRFRRWDDPDLSISLLDYRKPARLSPGLGRPSPFQLRMGTGSTSVWIPEEAFNAVQTTARSLGVPLTHGKSGGRGPPAGTEIYVFGVTRQSARRN